MRPSKIFATALSVLVLSAGCNQPVATTTDGKLRVEAPKISGLSTERWQIVQLPAQYKYIASVSGAAGRGSLLVSCETHSKKLAASIILDEELSGDTSSRSVDLLLDQGGFASPRWEPRSQVAGSPAAFDIVYDMDDYPDFDQAYYVYAHDFWLLLSNLEKHEKVVAVVRQGSREVSRYAFSLIDAQATIDSALQRCDRRKPR